MRHPSLERPIHVARMASCPRLPLEGQHTQPRALHNGALPPEFSEAMIPDPLCDLEDLRQRSVDLKAIDLTHDEAHHAQTTSYLKQQMPAG